MMRRTLFYPIVLFVAFAAASSTARAQAGRCANSQINQAYAALRTVPNGSANSGDCNPNSYGAGSWTGLPDLEIRIQHVHDCSNPWLGQIYYYLYNRKPSTLECGVAYSGGSTYMGLASGVQAYQADARRTAAILVPAPPLASKTQQPVVAKYHTDAKGNLLDASNHIIALKGQYTINGNNIVAGGGGNIVAGGAGNIVAGGGGNVVSGGNSPH